MSNAKPASPPISPGSSSGAAERNMEKIRGVFSTQEIRRVGTGTTTRKTVQKTFWFVEQSGDGKLECQPLSSNLVPTGVKRSLSMEDLIAKYAPEPEFYISAVYPKMQELQRAINSGDAHRKNGETFAAEFEYGNALKVDENNVRANFGIGLTYLQRGETDKAEDIFQRLVKLEAAFEKEHKHLFNDFGINLRKNKMFQQSVDYYARALELTCNDEHLHVNMARAMLENKNIDGCVEHLLNALALVPDNEHAQKFLDWMFKKNLVPQDKLEAAQAALRRPEEPVEA